MKKIIALVLAALLLLAGCASQNGSDAGQTDPNTTTTEPEEVPMKKTTLSFDSFDGGGPSYTAIMEDDSIVSFEKTVEYGREDHAEIDGAAFTVTFTFTGLKPGTTGLTVEERSPIAGNFDRSYTVTVAEDLTVTVEALGVVDLDAPEDPLRPIPTLVIAVGNTAFYAALEDTPAAEALTEALSQEPITVDLHGYTGFEKMGALPWALPQSDEKACTTNPGDVMLFQGDQIAIYYDSMIWDYTRLAKIEDVTKQELLEAFGNGDVTVTLWIEWSE